MHKDEGHFGPDINLMYNQNNLDIGFLNSLISKLHSCMLAIVFGSLVPWIPYFLQKDGGGFFSEINVLYDPFKDVNIYNNGLF